MKVNIGKYGKIYRKESVQIDYSDIWSLDRTLALIILPALLYLKEKKHGVPGEFVDVGGDNTGFQLCFDFYKESHNEAFEIGCERWDEVMDKIIWSFQQIVEDNCNDKYHYGQAKYNFVEIDDSSFVNPLTNKSEKSFRMEDANPGEHWFDIEGLRIHEERIQEGLELFGKYFRSFWD